MKEGRRMISLNFWTFTAQSSGKENYFYIVCRNSGGGSLEFFIDWIQGEECREITKFNPLYRLPISGLVCTRKLLCLTKYFVTDQSYAKSHKVARKFQ